MKNPLQGVVRLTKTGLIRAQGEEAAKFLHSQLTQDFSLMTQRQARLAGFCSAKGRLQASFIGIKRSNDEVWLLCSQDLLTTTMKRLSMFVMRAKVKLTDASDDLELYGLLGQAASAATQNLADPLSNPWDAARVDDVSLVRLYPADEVERVLWIGPKGARAPTGDALDESLWDWSEVRSGVATLTSPMVDVLVPQMLNYESIGGVNFKKGCYPGQEVVARSQFRGTLKRRTYLAHAASSLAVGAELFTNEDPEQPCGVVVQSAPAPEAGWDALVSMQISAFEGGRVFVGTPEGQALSLTPAPYPLLADI